MRRRAAAVTAVAAAVVAGAIGYWPRADDAEAFRLEAASAGAKEPITCKVGGASNYPASCYCHDNGTAGWLTKTDACESD